MSPKPSVKINYAVLSLLQYSFAILVILLHGRRLFAPEPLHFIQKSLLSRMAVPFFMASSSFLLADRLTHQATTFKIYITKLVKTYTYLSLLYLPYALWYFGQSQINPALLPLAGLFAFLYFGTGYHLWYFPALILALILVRSLKRYLSPQQVLSLCLLLYTLGSIETYSAYLTKTSLFPLFETYRHYFITTRNGLFFAPIFVLMGELAYEARAHKWLKQTPLRKLCLALVAFGLEGYLIYQRPGADKNFFFTLIPVTLFLLNWATRTPYLAQYQWSHLKKLSVYYFYLHPIFIELGFFLLAKSPLPLWQQGCLVTAPSLVLTHLLAHFLIKWQRRKRMRLARN